jgi:ABC-type phosphate transport system substrate-binding protein
MLKFQFRIFFTFSNHNFDFFHLRIKIFSPKKLLNNLIDPVYLSGTGSSFALPIYKSWSESFDSANDDGEDRKPDKPYIAYSTSLDIEQAVQNLEDEKVSFVGIDIFQQNSTFENDMSTVPTVVGAIAIVYHKISGLSG